MSLLKTELQTLFDTYHAPTTRYNHLGFSSKDFLILDELFEHLTALFPNYTVWHGENPNQTAPIIPCDSHTFIKKLFEPHYQGIIIHYPQYWFQRWTILEKQAFWSALSENHGAHPIIIIFTEGNDFSRINRNKFKAIPLNYKNITAWVSTKTLLK